MSEQPKQRVADYRQSLNIYPPKTVFPSHGGDLGVPAEVFALFTGEVVAKRVNSALCGILDRPSVRLYQDEKEALGLFRDLLSQALLTRKPVQGVLPCAH